MRVVLAFLMLTLAGCSGGTAPTDEAPLVDLEPEVEAPASNETVLTKSYVGQSFGSWTINTGCNPSYDVGGPSNVGGVCFPLANGTEKVRFEITDDNFANAGVWAYFDAGGSAGYFCNAGSASPPEEATVLFVTVIDFTCLLQTHPSASTSGTVTVTMYS